MATGGEADLVNGQIGEEENTEENTKEGEEENPNEKKHDKAACADLEKITDFEEDVEVKDIASAISLIEGRRSEENTIEIAREKELSQVKVKKEDIELIVNEMEVSHSIAQRKLREAGGDVVQALIMLTG